MGDLSKLSWRVIDAIQKTIEAKGMTDAEVIVKSGVPRNTFYRKMRGDTPLTTDDIDRIATALGVDPFSLLMSKDDFDRVARGRETEPTDEQ